MWKLFICAWRPLVCILKYNPLYRVDFLHVIMPVPLLLRHLLFEIVSPGCMLEAGKEVLFNPEEGDFEHQLDLRMVRALKSGVKLAPSSQIFLFIIFCAVTDKSYVWLQIESPYNR